MENLRDIWKIAQASLVVALVSAAIVPTTHVLAYSPYNTHQLFTQEIGEFYNYNGPAYQLSQEEINLLRRGAVEEDEPPRWLNHFYHTTKKTGWDGANLGKSTKEEAISFVRHLTGYNESIYSSYDWATNETAQIKYGLNKTWPYAVREFAKGHKQTALVALGNILHLIEDGSVPDHTRNDAHPESILLSVIDSKFVDSGSPYENFARNYTSQFSELQTAEVLLQERKMPNRLNNLREAFDTISLVSGQNFFSEDTILDNDFAQPNINMLTRRYADVSINGRIYQAEFRLNTFNQAPVVYTNIDGKFSTADQDHILPSYYYTLSRQTVLVGAGVLDLFFREVQNYNPQDDFSDVKTSDIALKEMGAGTNRLIRLAFGAVNVGAQLASFINDAQDKLTPKQGGTDILAFSPSLVQAASGSLTPTTGQTQAPIPSQQPKKTPANSPSPAPSATATPPPSPAPSPAVPSPTASPASSPTVMPQASSSTPLPSMVPVSGSVSASPPSCSDLAGSQYPHLLINEVKFEGASSKDEFVELYNPTEHDIDLRCWALKRKGAKTSDSSSDTESLLVSKSSFQGTMPAHGFFLVANPQGIYKDQADLTYSSAGYSIANNNTVLLYDPAGQLSGKVGFGSDATKIKDYETQPFIAPAFGETQSIQRKNFQDTNNNANDFWLHTAAAHNSRSAPILPSQAFFDFTAVSLSNFTVSSGSLKFSWDEPDAPVPPEALAVLTYSISAATSSDFSYSYKHFLADTQTDTVLPKPEMRGAGKVFSFPFRCPEQTTNYTFKLTAVNADDLENVPRGATSSYAFLPQDCAETPSLKVLISEVQVESSSSTHDEFIELYNPNVVDVDLTGWRLAKKTSGGTETSLITKAGAHRFSGVIRGHGYLLIAHPEAGLTAAPDVLYASSNSVTPDNTVLLYDPRGHEVDKVGFGNAQDYETAPFPQNPRDGQSIERKAYASSTAGTMRSDGERLWGNGYDTDNNAADFILMNTGNPQNSSSTPEQLPAEPTGFSVTVVGRNVVFSWRNPVVQTASTTTGTTTYAIRWRHLLLGANTGEAGWDPPVDPLADAPALRSFSDIDPSAVIPLPEKHGELNTLSTSLCNFYSDIYDFALYMVRDGVIASATSTRVRIGEARWDYGQIPCPPRKINDLTATLDEHNHLAIAFTPQRTVNASWQEPAPVTRPLRLIYMVKISDDRSRLENEFFNPRNISLSSETGLAADPSVTRAMSHQTTASDYYSCEYGTRCIVFVSMNEFDPAKTYSVAVKSHYLYYWADEITLSSPQELNLQEISELSNIADVRVASSSPPAMNPYLVFSWEKQNASTTLAASIKQKASCPEKNAIPEYLNPQCEILLYAFPSSEAHPGWMPWQTPIALTEDRSAPLKTLKIQEAEFDPVTSPATTTHTLAGWGSLTGANASVPGLVPGQSFVTLLLVKQWYYLDYTGTQRIQGSVPLFVDENKYYLQGE